MFVTLFFFFFSFYFVCLSLFLGVFIVFCSFSCVHFIWWTCLWAISIFICCLHLANGNFCVIFINVYCERAFNLSRSRKRMSMSQPSPVQSSHGHDNAIAMELQLEDMASRLEMQFCKCVTRIAKCVVIEPSRGLAAPRSTHFWPNCIFNIICRSRTTEWKGG